MDHSGGCLCGALRYRAAGEPLFSGHCYCGDCRKASGSGFIPFMVFPAAALSVPDAAPFVCVAAGAPWGPATSAPAASLLIELPTLSNFDA